MKSKLPRIVLLLPYYGRLPVYFPIFLRSLFYNKDILDVLFISDIDVSGMELPDNFLILPLSLDGFKKRIKVCTGFEPDLSKLIKLCDLKPLYGAAFVNEIKDYEYYAIGDCDLIYGNLSKHLEQVEFWNYDVLSFRRHWIAASFCLFRNSKQIREIFLYNPDLEKIVISPEHFCADECGPYWDELSAGIKLSEISGSVTTLTHQVLELEKKEKLRYFHQDILTEKLSKKELINFDCGHLSCNNKPVMIFHYVFLKHKKYFHFPVWKECPDKFWIDNTGFYTPRSFCFRHLISLKRQLKWILASLKENGVANFYNRFRNLLTFWGILKKKV